MRFSRRQFQPYVKRHLQILASVREAIADEWRAIDRWQMDSYGYTSTHPEQDKINSRRHLEKRLRLIADLRELLAWLELQAPETIRRFGNQYLPELARAAAKFRCG